MGKRILRQITQVVGASTIWVILACLAPVMIWAEAVMIWAGAVLLLIQAGACSNTNFPTLEIPHNAKKA